MIFCLTANCNKEIKKCAKWYKQNKKVKKKILVKESENTFLKVIALSILTFASENE